LAHADEDLAGLEQGIEVVGVLPQHDLKIAKRVFLSALDHRLDALVIALLHPDQPLLLAPFPVPVVQELSIAQHSEEQRKEESPHERSDDDRKDRNVAGSLEVE